MCRNLAILLTAVVSVASLGCATSTPPSPHPGRVQHVVVCWLKEPGNVTQRQALIDASRRLNAIPGVIAVSAGSVMPSERAVVDSTFDIALVMTFTDADAMRRYLTAAQHLDMMRNMIQPLTQRVLIYDFAE